MPVRVARQLTLNAPSGYARAVAVTYSQMYLLHGGARSATTRLVSFTQRCRLVSARIGATTICTHKSMSANASSASSHDDEHEATTSQDEALQTPVHHGDGARRSRGMC